jgi:hypothetical protein
MIPSFSVTPKLSFVRLLSSAVLIWITTLSPVWAHEVLPSIADMTQEGDSLTFDVRLNVESFIAGIDQTAVADTNAAPQAGTYDELRALNPADLEARFAEFWPQMADKVMVLADGVAVIAENPSLNVAPIGNPEVVRASDLSFTAAIPAGTQSVQVGWAPEFGVLVLRQMGVDAPYDGYLEAGALSAPIALAGGDQATRWQTFVRYIPIGFDHIVPKGLDHILFVLGLFFLSARMRPLLTQVSLFTLAHTITLALAALGYVVVPGSIVEPLIAASIVYVAVENIFMKNLSPWRPFVVFGFGLLHGLGFASVLAEFGLPESAFVPALIGFNVGVEIGQLSVIAVMFLCVWQAVRVDRGSNEASQVKVLYIVLAAAAGALAWLNPTAISTAIENPTWLFAIPLFAIFLLCLASIQFRDHVEAYRKIVAIPASVAIAFVGAYWFVERVFL